MSGTPLRRPKEDEARLYFIIIIIKLNMQANFYVIGGTWGRDGYGGCTPQIGCLFGLSGMPMTPFYLKIGLDIGHVSRSSLPIGGQKYLGTPIYMVKSTDWFLKNALQETNGLDIGCTFASSLVYL